MSIDNQLSKMYYCRICSNKEYHAIQLIEPLVDLIRNPLTMCPRISSVPSNLYLTREFALQSKRFLLFASSSSFHIDSPLTTTMASFALWLYTSGSRKILIDIDSSYFKSRNGNIAEIDELPHDVYPIYTFINVGVEAKIGKFNAWNMLESIAKPNDYVVIKLDIDKPSLESALMKQLLDELFFEKHVSNNSTSKKDKLKDFYDLFTKLGEYGIRMHGWP
ncbi:unnamed protein product [Rotaria sp. Silwood1]|nr:unnamed protein product [Rotaria sp. Silwood1]